MKSRVNREVHARICEGLGVKFPGATRPAGILLRRSIRWFSGAAKGRTDHVEGIRLRSFDVAASA